MSDRNTCCCLDDIIRNLDEDDLSDVCSNFCNDRNTENVSDVDDTFYYCELLNLFQCFTSRYMNLIFIVLFMYWWNNQAMNCYLTNSNCQLTNALSDLLQQCFECNCCNKK